VPETIGRLPFCDANVLAFRAGRKTQTRRLGGLKQVNEAPDDWRLAEIGDVDGRYEAEFSRVEGGAAFCTARFAPGDLVAITEAFAVIGDTSGTQCADVTVNVKYRADGAILEDVVVPESHWDTPTAQVVAKWHPPRFMPLWAVRPDHCVVITRTRAQRLQDITVGDAIAEGYPHATDLAWRELGPGLVAPPEDARKVLAWFRNLWDPLHTRDGLDWVVNPWDFAYTFAREEAER